MEGPNIRSQSTALLRNMLALPVRFAALLRPDQWILAAIFLPAAVVIVEMQSEMTNHHWSNADILRDYLAGALHAVFSTRVLMRWAILALWNASPFILSPSETYFLLQIPIVWAALVISADCAGRFMPRIAALASALLTAAILPWGMTRLGDRVSYPYDLSSLFFSAAAIACICAGRTRAFLVLLVLGTLNKETMVWLIPGFAARVAGQFRGEPRKAAKSIVLALALFAAAYYAPRAVYNARTSGKQGLKWLTTATWVHEQRKTTKMEKPPDIPRWKLNIIRLGQSWTAPAENLYLALLVHLPGLLFVRRLPRPIRQLYWGVPVFLGSMWFFGFIWEVRIFNELLPLSTMSLVWLLLRTRSFSLAPDSQQPIALDGPEG